MQLCKKTVFLPSILGLILLIFSDSYAQMDPKIVFSGGYGQSFGGLGISSQVHLSPEVGLHGGVGYFPSSLIADFVPDVILLSLGIRLYAPLELNPFYPYMDMQIGGIGVEAVQYFDSLYGYSEEWEILIGPSFLLGCEVRFELMDGIGGGFFGGLGLSYITNDIDWLNQKILLTLDMGVSLYLTE